ncbi:MAG: heme-binding protein [Chlorobium phaeobacteroides]|nr:heme-binding protein [Chlorobium phaeobacteroides]
MNSIVLVLMSGFLLAGCSVVGKRSADEPSFTLQKKDGVFEVRHYGRTVYAETVVDGAYAKTSGVAFSRLAGYIFGKNRAKQKIPMTAPVLQEPVSLKIPMTAPVLQEKKGDGWLMSFVMPDGSRLETLPEPLDPAVKLREAEGRSVAVIGYAGLHSEKNIRKYAGLLKEWIGKKGYRAISEPRAASYDPPWTIPFLRRNEVQIDVE